MVLPYNRMFIMVLAAAIVGMLMALFFRTRFGLKLRATTQNRANECLRWGAGAAH